MSSSIILQNLHLSTESTAVRLLQPHSSDVEHEVREEQINIDGNENYSGTHHEDRASS